MTKPTATETANQRKHAGQILYGSRSGDDCRQSIESYFGKREMKLNAKSDREGLAQSRSERQQIKAFAAQHGLRVDDVRTLLTTLHDHESFPRSPAAIEARRARTWNVLCEEYGGAAGAQAALTHADKFAQVLKSGVPSVAERAIKTGANEDPALICILARYGAEPVSNTY